ncbi:MAG: hypothetical protein H6R13_2438 [Proteobacteria bacterium]|nr:hypothetical protein [Pseudomonadota bacterium]
MIPPDVASSLRQVLPDQSLLNNAQTQPVAAAQKVADVLSGLVPGQRILAEISSLLPNGSYRAVVAQRDVTLALPFSAKPGDTLELEVAESDGKITLAFVANRTDNSAAKANLESVSTSLSPAGKLIGTLMNEIGGEGRKAPPVPLNGSAPILNTMPDTAADIAPILKQALTQSGMFYEAHQARWVAGQLPTEALRQEPQGKLSPLPIPGTADQAPGIKTGDIQSTNAISIATAAPAAATDQATPTTNRIPHELTPLVQQQLDGLSTQNFAWQGQIWPGQEMWWEIGEDGKHTNAQNDEESQKWQTRLKLSLPVLGQIEATLNLNAGGEVTISLFAGNEASEVQLRNASAQLTSQFEAAGLHLTQLSLQQHGQTE